MGKFNKNHGKFTNKNHNNKKQFHGRPQKNFNNEEFKRNDRQDQPKVTLREDQVGITEYVNKTTAGFKAVIKSRYSDFHVNEISLDNKVLILNDLEIPKPQNESSPAEESVIEPREKYKEIISEEDWSKIEDLAKATAKDASSTLEPIEIDINELDKEQRTEIHNLFKKNFAGKLVSTTITKDDKRYVRVQKAKGSRDEKREKWMFPGEYVKFLVHKENMDTTAVASTMARSLSMIPSRVNYCGTKDKRAITTQLFCVKRRKPSDIFASVRSLRNVRIGNFSFGNEVLKLGQLRGNRFRIALRHIDAPEDVMEKALKNLKEFGFINYFGMQRFGNCVEVPTFEVGVALMKADYKTAVELILKPREGDLPFLKTIRETWWKNRNAKEAVDLFRGDRFIEKKLLDGLAKHGENDYATALRKLPRNLLLLYPHAFQSLIFNKIASKRIHKYGLEPMIGDLVYSSPNEENEEYIPDDGNVDNIDEEEDVVESNEANENEKSESSSRQKVRTLTADDISGGNYSIYDVVLPLPGFDVQYPQNELDDWYKDALNEYGLTSESLNHNVKTFKLSGTYRKLLILPSDLSWEFCCYDRPDAQLIQSDWELLKGIACENRFPIEKYTNDNTLNRALVLEFNLPPACYATMLLRELLKMDTSSGHQSSVELQAKALKQNENECAEKRAAEENTSEQDCDEAPLSKIPRTST